VPVVEFDGIDIDQVPLTETVRVVEAIIGSGVDRESLQAAVQSAAPRSLETLAKLCDNVDRDQSTI
jgi:hypothetical protein